MNQKMQWGMWITLLLALIMAPMGCTKKETVVVEGETVYVLEEDEFLVRLQQWANNGAEIIDPRTELEVMTLEIPHAILTDTDVTLKLTCEGNCEELGSVKTYNAGTQTAEEIPSVYEDNVLTINTTIPAADWMWLRVVATTKQDLPLLNRGERKTIRFGIVAENDITSTAKVRGVFPLWGSVKSREKGNLLRTDSGTQVIQRNLETGNEQWVRYASDATPSTQTTKMVFLDTSSGDRCIAVANLNGSEYVAGVCGWDITNPRLTKNDAYVLYARNGSIYRMPSAGGDEESVIISDGATYYDFPIDVNGTTFVIGTVNWGDSNVYRIEDGIATNVTNDTQKYKENLTADPQTSLLAFTTWDTNGSSSVITTMQPDGSERKNLTEPKEGVFNYYPAFDPNDNRILFLQNNWYGQSGLFMSDKAGENMRRVSSWVAGSHFLADDAIPPTGE